MRMRRKIAERGDKSNYLALPGRQIPLHLFRGQVASAMAKTLRNRSIMDLCKDQRLLSPHSHDT